MLSSLILIVLSSFLWRVRGGLRIFNKKIPLNKIWYSVFFAVFCCFYFLPNVEIFILGFITCYASYQLYGWGLYIGRLLVGGELKPNLKQYTECELIDDLLYSLHITIKGNKYELYKFPKLFGFIGTSLTGLIIAFLWGILLNNILFIVSGLAMGVCYWLGGKLEKIKPLGKNGWNWGEWIFGAYLGAMLTIIL